jgi:hypothetical protein
LRRPVIVGDTILIEPRGCDLKTGEIKTRPHPLTKNDSTWEFVRPGHCCSITSAAPNMFFLRGYFLWYYDMNKDQGMLPFGAIRPGCWINTIPANGVVLFPEASSGCTCSYPIRSTVVLQPKKEQRTWSFAVQHGEQTPVSHLAVNFGAPGDWRDDDGTMWFGYPHPPSTRWQTYGVDFDLHEKFASAPSFFSEHVDGAGIKGTDKPWLYASGSKGMTGCVVPLLGEEDEPTTYTVRLFFLEPENDSPGKRVFSVRLQGEEVLTDFDPYAEANGANVALVKEFSGVRVESGLEIALTPAVENPSEEQMPVIQGIEVIRETSLPTKPG